MGWSGRSESRASANGRARRSQSISRNALSETREETRELCLCVMRVEFALGLRLCVVRASACAARSSTRACMAVAARNSYYSLSTSLNKLRAPGALISTRPDPTTPYYHFSSRAFQRKKNEFWASVCSQYRTSRVARAISHVQRCFPT